MTKDVFPYPALKGVVRTIRERLARFMGVQGKNVPKKDNGFYLIQNPPNDCRRTFGHGYALSWFLDRNAPPFGVGVQIDVISKG